MVEVIIVHERVKLILLLNVKLYIVMETFQFVLSLTSLWTRSYSMIKYNFFNVFRVFFKLKSSICLDFEERCCFAWGIFLAIQVVHQPVQLWLSTILFSRYNCRHQHFYSQKITQRVFLPLTRLFRQFTLTERLHRARGYHSKLPIFTKSKRTGKNLVAK